MNFEQKHYKHLLIPIIKKHLPTCTIYLFGSRARNTHQEGADIDIALDAGSKIDFTLLSKILDDIEESMVPVQVDVIDYHNISTAMKEEIDNEGIQWEK